MAKSIKLDSPYYWSSRGIWHEEMILKNYLDTLSTNIKTNTSNITTINTNNLLWSGASYMNGSQSITLSDTISNQTNGIVLVFCAYKNGAAQNYNWAFTFIPKYFVVAVPGAGTFHVMGGTEGVSNTKYIYVYNNKLTGNKANDNDGYVLRYVIGV